MNAKIFAQLLLALFVGGCATPPKRTLSAADKHSFPYAETEAVSWGLSSMVMREGIELRLAKPKVVHLFVSGEYRRDSSVDWSGGFILHVFPDHTAMIAEWYDVAPDQKVVAEGDWCVSSGGDVLFNWARWDFDSASHEEYFKKGYGVCKVMKQLLCFNEGELQDIVLISAEMVGLKDPDAFRRRREYVDWHAVANDLRKSKH